MKNVINEKKLLQERVELIYASLKDGNKTYASIAKAISLPDFTVKRIIHGNPELMAAYKIRKQMVADKAAGNIQAIIDDPTHPKHFEASKLVIQKYKSELDENLEAQDSDTLAISGDSDEEGNKSVTLVFK